MGRLRQGDLCKPCSREASSIMFLSLGSGVCCRKACKQQNLSYLTSSSYKWLAEWWTHSTQPKMGAGCREGWVREKTGGTRGRIGGAEPPAQSMEPWSRCLSFHLFSGLVSSVIERDWARWRSSFLAIRMNGSLGYQQGCYGSACALIIVVKKLTKYHSPSLKCRSR